MTDNLVSNSDGTQEASALPSVAFNQPHLAPGSDQPLVVSGGSGSTSDVTADSKRQAVGWVPGTRICIKNPA